ncbi:bicaudal d-related-like protein [Lasius niger]|uniref:Bicaudal d-related-like protein n=1 Tax=Lasius niger TaxID=67767 RepID=A0A0J7L9J7_LASNI|nr:bicaudal d-related-like protein [Lasius niger]
MLPKKDSQTEPYVLEDMISDLQARRHSLDQEDVVQDPAELLKQRERDLVLAAELGKALLERNQELTKQAEVLAEEYSTKLERASDFVHGQTRFLPRGDYGKPRKRGNKLLRQQPTVSETMPGTTLCLPLPTHVLLSFRVLAVALFLTPV